MSRKAKTIAISLCAAQVITMIPVSAAAAESQLSTTTIAVGENHSLVIKSDMSLWAAGDNSKGQLGVGTDKSSSSGEKIMDNIVYVDANEDVSFAIDKNGTLYGWGDNSDGQVSNSVSGAVISKPTKIMDNVKQVSTGDGHTVALLEDGTAVGWGRNEYGELGFATNSLKNSVTELMKDAVDVTAGDGFTLVVSKDGAVYGCGNNENGQLGTGNYRDYTYLKVVIEKGAVDAEAGDEHSVVLMADGSVKTSGSNENGQLGVDDYTGSSDFISTTVKNADAVFAGGNSSGAVSGGVLYTWGSNESGQLHNGDTADVYSPERVTNGVVSIALGHHHSLMLKNNGYVSSVGAGVSGELFTSASSIAATPVYAMGNVSVFSAGKDHAAAINTDGVLYTWGNNDKGQLGQGDYNVRSTPTRVKLDYAASNVWCGNKVTIVQLVNDAVYVFGDNSSYLLGEKTKTSIVNKPTENEYLSSMTIDKIEFQNDYAIALIGGQVYGWGINSSGRLSTCGSVVKYPELLYDKLPAIYDIAAGDNHCVAITSGGELYGWGSNSAEQLGGDTTTRIVDVPELINVTDSKDNPISIASVAAEGSHTIAVAYDGNVYAWGDNSYGQLGDDSSRLRYPTKVYVDSNKVFSSEKFSAVLTTSGDIYLSGNNASGQLGDGTAKSRKTFAKITKGNVSTASLGGDFAGYISYDSKLYCWGDNTYGQCGNGKGGLKSQPETVIKDGLCQKPVQAVPAESVSLDKTEITLKPNATAKLTATVAPDNATDKSVTWSSSDTTIATVTSTGSIKAVKNGTAVITAKTSNGLTAQCTVNVSTPISSFSVNPAKTKTLDVDGKFTITAKIYPEAATDKTLLYSSSNEDVAVVDENGTVTAVSAGSAKITITAKSNPAKTRTITVKVRPSKPVITYRKSTTDGIVLEWDLSDYAEGYEVYRRNSAKGRGKSLTNIVSDDPDDMTFTDGTAVKGKIYYYYVKSYVTINGKKLYSNASKIYKIKAK